MIRITRILGERVENGLKLAYLKSLNKKRKNKILRSLNFFCHYFKLPSKIFFSPNQNLILTAKTLFTSSLVELALSNAAFMFSLCKAMIWSSINETSGDTTNVRPLSEALEGTWNRLFTLSKYRGFHLLNYMEGAPRTIWLE